MPQGGLGRGAADVGARAGKSVFEGGRPVRGGHADIDEADGFFGGAAGWAGDAGDGDGDIGAGGGAGAFGHGAGGFEADGAMGGEDAGRDAEQAELEFVGVGDHAAEIPRGTAGQARERGADEAARAGFGRGEGLLPREQAGGDLEEQRFHVRKSRPGGGV